MNYLKMAEKQRILALLELGWGYRRIQRETGVRREVVARYGPRRGPKPASVSTGCQSAAEPYRAFIDASIARGLPAQRIWRDLREDYGFNHGYCSVKRFVRSIKRRRPEVADALEHPSGAEAQVDFFKHVHFPWDTLSDHPDALQLVGVAFHMEAGAIRFPHPNHPLTPYERPLPRDGCESSPDMN